jgi:hypothetical protein
MTREQRPLGHVVLRATLIGSGVGVIALLSVTLCWLGVNVYLESQKTTPGVPDLVSPPFFAALYFLPYVVPTAGIGALIGVLWWLVTRAVRSIAARNAR